MLLIKKRLGSLFFMSKNTISCSAINKHIHVMTIEKHDFT